MHEDHKKRLTQFRNETLKMLLNLLDLPNPDKEFIKTQIESLENISYDIGYSIGYWKGVEDGKKRGEFRLL